MEFHHVSILLQPCLDALNIKPDGVYVDATTGGAGHSLHIAQELGEGGRLICIDRDDEALENAKTRLASVWDRVTTVKSDFRDIDRVLEGQVVDHENHDRQDKQDQEHVADSLENVFEHKVLSSLSPARQ